MASLIEYLSGFMTLGAGDVILTGTPEGVVNVDVGDEVRHRSRRHGPPDQHHRRRRHVRALKPTGEARVRIQHLIDGKPVDSRATFETINPATQEVLAEVADGGADEVNAAVAAAKAAFPAWAARPRHPNVPH